jgi:diguanylate cyclase (GGDEF)-like protein
VSPVGKKTVQTAESTESRGLDEALVGALLRAYQAFELGDQVQVVLEETASWSGATFGVAYVAEQGRRSLVPVASTAGSEEDPRFLAFTPVNPGRLGGGSLQDRLAAYEGFGPFEEVIGEWPGDRPRSTLALPLVSSRGRWAGLVVLLLQEDLSAEVRERLDRLLEMMRPAADNALRVLSMRDLVIKDDTAQCFNRRHFEESLPEELARASRYRSPVSLIFLDMDNLKEVNTRFGHAMGSQTLYEVSVRVRSKIRKFDKLFRFGGDEFCIVLPETEWHGALEVAERVRDAISNKPFLARDVNDGKGVAMSASLGIASFPLHARSRATLIQRADRAMQKIKKTTKNAIGISEIEEQDDDE